MATICASCKASHSLRCEVMESKGCESRIVSVLPASTQVGLYMQLHPDARLEISAACGKAACMAGLAQAAGRFRRDGQHHLRAVLAQAA